MSYVPLHVHSQYSILDATASVVDLVKKAKEYSLSALALTDQGNLYGAVEFYKECKAAQIKPILGCELYLAPTSRFEKKKVPGQSAGYNLVLLAKNAVGYKHLCELSTLAHLEGFYYTPRIDKQLLAEKKEGLICLSGSLNSLIASIALKGDKAALYAEISFWQQLFGQDFYLEIQRHKMTADAMEADQMAKEPWLLQYYHDYIAQEQAVEQALREAGKDLGVSLVATNDTRYLERKDWRAHEILMNIGSGEVTQVWLKDSLGNLKEKVPNPKRQVKPTHELDFKSSAAMNALFADFPEALANSQLIAEKCQVELDFKTKHYPVYVPPSLEGKQYSAQERKVAADDFLRQLCEEGLKKRYTEERLAKVREQHNGKDPLEVIRLRLALELDIIISKGMCDYLLIVYDFINWAKNNRIPMGPGRGSGAGSIILYLIGITDIEPLRFHLFFERFINPERLSYPDIDVDICMDRRSEVIDYTVQKYGKEKVAQIITFGTMKAKMAIKDVGRVLNVPLAKVNEIAKLIPDDLNMTIDKALEIDPELKRVYESDPETTNLIDLAKDLEGSVRNTGIHAAGLIICGDALLNHIPLCNAKDSPIAATQFSMKPVESVGMLKIDFLGLKTLTSIQIAVDAVKKYRKIDIDWVNLPLDDMNTFNLLNQGKTLGIFQLESGGMQDLAKQLHIDKFEEIIAVGALYRPGPMEMIPSFINRKHGREVIEIDHPLMADVLAETYGIMVYQEQVMQIASLLAGYSLGEGDVLRRAMGKKDREEMARQREKFKLGAQKNGIEETLSMQIFDKVEKFASYGFNKSHAAAYGFLTYVTAYLKANYPGEWMAALMTCDRDDISKVAKVIRECQAMGIAILPPDINESNTEFVSTEAGVRFALNAIKGVGEGVVQSIIEERTVNGKFPSLIDFVRRIDTKKIGKKVVENLIEAGAFDFTSWTRPELLASLEPMFAYASKEQKDAAKGFLDLFAGSASDSYDQFLTPVHNVPAVSKRKLLQRENELLGFYLTAHPLDEFREQIKAWNTTPLSEIGKLTADVCIVSCFIIETCQVKISSKHQRKFAILTISDSVERFELPIWSDLYEQNAHLIQETQLLYAVLQVDKQEEGFRLSAKALYDLHQINEDTLKESLDVLKKCQGSLKAFERKEKQRDDKKTLPKEDKMIRIRFDLQKVRLSHIMTLQHIISNHPGSNSLELDFLEDTAKYGTVVIDSKWGVELSPMLEQMVKSIQSVIGFELIEKV